MIKSKTTEKCKKRPLISLSFIIIPTVAIVVATLIVLQNNGFFMSTEEKLLGNFTRERTGKYSALKYTESYSFNKNGTGTKTYLTPDGEVSTNEFTWHVTPKNILVINGHIKYEFKSGYEEYYNSSANTTKKYWYVTKDNLYFGENTSIAYEEYTRN